MVLQRFTKFALPALLLFSFACGCFAYGFVVGAYEVFPYRILRDARTAQLALVSVARGSVARPSGVTGQPDDQRNFLVPSVIDHADRGGDELLLVSGGQGYHRDRHSAGCLAWLMDRAGKIRHIWKHDPRLWDKLQSVTRLPGSSDALPIGLHVFDNGDLLVNYQGANTFPFAIGMARFDKDSRLLWKKELNTHHWFSVAPDGRIFVPAVRVVDSPLAISGTSAKITSDTGKIYSDFILILDAGGNVLQEISMLDALYASGWEGLLLRTNMKTCVTDDPLHTNDVRLVGDELAQAQPWLNAEDLLISFRNINAVGILDIKTQRFKWMGAGASVWQHSPRFYDGGVLVLDNLGGDQRTGGTQLVNIDLQSGLPSRIFPRENVAIPGPCHVSSAGHLDLHRDGQRVLLTKTHDGTLWEIDLQSGEVLWEYVYVAAGEDRGRQELWTAKYVYAPSFLSEGEAP